MTRVAVISDIHANLPALEAVLADVERQAVGQVFCAGGRVGLGPHPNQAVSRVRSAAICWCARDRATSRRATSVWPSVDAALRASSAFRASC